MTEVPKDYRVFSIFGPYIGTGGGGGGNTINEVILYEQCVVATTGVLAFSYVSASPTPDQDRFIGIPPSPIIDGVVVQNNQRILVKDQTNLAHNGIYTYSVGTASFVRSSDWSRSDDPIPKGATMVITEGTANAGSEWSLKNAVVTVGSDPAEFVTSGASVSLTAGPGIKIDGGSTISVDNSSDFTFSGNSLALNTISVSKGGTGRTTLTTNSFLVGNGTSPVAFKTSVPTGVVVGTTDTQTLSGKTFTGLSLFDSNSSHRYTFATGNLTANRTIDIPVLTGNDTLVFQNETQTVSGKRFIDFRLWDTNTAFHYVFSPSVLANNRTITLPALTAADTLVFENHTQNLSNKTINGLRIFDNSLNNAYTIGVPNLAANRTITLPLLTANDTFVTANFAQTLANKTITSAPSITSTGVITSGSSVVATTFVDTPELKNSLSGTLIIEGVPITTIQYGYLGALDQSVATTDTPTFNGLDANNQIISGVFTPAVGTDAANKDYVDSVAGGGTLNFFTNVVVATTADLGLVYVAASPSANKDQFTGTGASPSIDGYSLNNNNRILVKDQALPEQNGIYRFVSGTQTYDRTTDWDRAVDPIVANTAVLVTNGTTNVGAQYALSATVTVVGTDPANFNQVGQSVVYSPGNGIKFTGNTISVDNSTDFGFTTNKLRLNTVSVAKGGTGRTNLTNNAVLIGTGATPVNMTKLAPSGNFVGDTDAQVLTTKTISCLANDVDLDGATFQSVTFNSGVSLNSIGNILTITPSGAAWQPPTGGGGSYIGIAPINVTGLNISLNTVDVAHGGTGKTSLNGGFLIGNGTGAILDTKAVPGGIVVGDSDPQTLTQKIITDPSNTVSAYFLSAPSGLILTGATNPVMGGALTITNMSPMTAQWVLPTTGSIIDSGFDVLDTNPVIFDAVAPTLSTFIENCSYTWLRIGNTFMLNGFIELTIGNTLFTHINFRIPVTSFQPLFTSKINVTGTGTLTFPRTSQPGPPPLFSTTAIVTPVRIQNVDDPNWINFDMFIGPPAGGQPYNIKFSMGYQLA